MALQSTLFTLSCCVLLLGTISAVPLAYEDNFNGEALEEFQLLVDDYEPIPIRIQHRQRRQVYGGVSAGQPGGIQGTAGVGGTIYERNGHRVDGHGQVSKNWGPKGPTTVGGGLDYTGPRGGASIGAQHQHRMGTNVQAEGRYNVYSSPNGRTTVDAHGGYQRSYGGPYGTSRPNYNVGVGLTHRF